MTTPSASFTSSALPVLEEEKEHTFTQEIEPNAIYMHSPSFRTPGVLKEVAQEDLLLRGSEEPAVRERSSDQMFE